MARKWCLNCSQFVEPKKSVNWIGMFLSFPLYIWWYIFKAKRCPMCNGTNFTETNPKTAKKLE